MYEQVRQVVHDSGLWDNGRESSHGFVLSPSVYEVPREKWDELEAIGAALHDCLAGIGQIAAKVNNPYLRGDHTCGMIARALRTAVPAIYHDLMLLRPKSVPAICKVDLMESSNGRYCIAEIDGHNKHGLGYSTLAARIRKVVAPGVRAFPGVAAAIAQEVRGRGAESLILLYADRERFYLPEFQILRSELASYGVNLVVVAESEVRADGAEIIIANSRANAKLFVDFPFLYFNQALNSRLAKLYRQGEIDFLIPPKPFLGSKAILALLRNDLDDEWLERILRSEIHSSSLELLRRYIPETYLLHRRKKAAYWQARCDGKGFVLKESISSGMKGTLFSDDERFRAMLEAACGSFYRFILQEEIQNNPHRFCHFGGDGQLMEDQWYVRITAHYTLRGVADLVITARRDKKVHGAKDCLQLGSIIV